MHRIGPKGLIDLLSPVILKATKFTKKALIITF